MNPCLHGRPDHAWVDGVRHCDYCGEVAPLPKDFDRRIGRFTVSRFMVHADPQAVIAALSGGIVIRCEFMFADFGLEYMMLHPAFDPVSNGIVAPEYECLFHRHDDLSVTHEWRRR